jgi:hypothetical protein
MRRFMLVAASAATLACLGACSDGGDVAQDVTTQPTVSSEPTPLDPFAWTDVPYREYLDAAQEIGVRPDVLVSESGFSAGLDALCHTSSADLAALRKTQLAKTHNTETYSDADYLGDEVGLRIGLACPQRMSDWTATSDGETASDGEGADDISAVTDEDLARARAEEAGATGEPDYGHSASSSPSPDASDSSGSSDSSDSSHTSSSSDDGEVSTTSSGGVTTGNGTPTR